MSDYTPDDAIIKKLQGLLNMTVANGASEAEAANAAAIAQRLADAHNVEIAQLRSNIGVKSDKTREDKRLNGGLYKWQRDLYAAIAKLNHCLYWCTEEREEGKVSAYWAKKLGAAEARRLAEEFGGEYWGKTWRHRIVGSKLNVMLSNQMAEYLQAAIERLARDYVDNDPKRYFIARAIAFREGAADRVVRKLVEERERRMREEHAKQEEQRRNNPTGTALVLADYIEQEEEANYDFQYGEGAWAARKAREAQWRADAEERRKAAEEAQKAQEEWDRLHPAEAAARKAEEAREAAEAAAERAKQAEKWAKQEAKNAARRKGRVQYYKPGKEDKAGYWDGHSAGAGIGLDRQVNDSRVKGHLK